MPVFFERLHDTNENIEINSDHSRDDVNPAPMSGEFAWVTRVDRDGEHEQREDAKANGRCETTKRKEEAGHTR